MELTAYKDKKMPQEALNIYLMRCISQHCASCAVIGATD